MRRHLATLSFALLALAHLDWARLAFAGGLSVFGAALAVEALAFGALAARPAWLRPLALVAIACELAGILLLGIGGLALAFNLLIVAGLALVAWRAAVAPGAYVMLTGYVLYAAGHLLDGQTFLLLGLALCIGAWAILSWSAFASPAQGSLESNAVAHAGGRP